MVWGLISFNGPEVLVWLNEEPNETLNKDAYIDILKDNLINN